MSNWQQHASGDVIEMGERAQSLPFSWSPPAPVARFLREEKSGRAVFILDKLSEIPYNSLLQFQWLQARSSVGERFPDTEEVGGSKPPGPTMIALSYGYSSMSSIL